MEQIGPIDKRLGIGVLPTLIRLFILGCAVPVEVAERALAPLGVSRALAANLLLPAEEGVAAAVRLTPDGDEGVVVLYDYSDGAGRDEVMAVTPSSKTLAYLTVRRPAESALDLGTGCGYQALLLARHAEKVVATDLNERAVAFAGFNALLNGATNCHSRSGNLFEPVGNQRFDLIVSNPPFVISPDHDLLFRDGGFRGDGISSCVVRGAAERLNEGGFATVLINWAHPVDAWEAPLRTWVEGCGCDAVLLHFVSFDPAAYAASWNKSAGDPNRLAQAVARWVAYYEELGIEAIGYGAVILRRRAGSNWLHSEHVPTDVAGPSSDQLLRLFAAQDLLRSLPDPHSLLSGKLQFNPAHRMDQQLKFRDGDWGVVRSTLKLEEGMQFGANIDPPTAQLLGFLDGTRTLAEAVRATAQLLEIADSSAFAEASIPVVSRLIELGILIAQ